MALTYVYMYFQTFIKATNSLNGRARFTPSNTPAAPQKSFICLFAFAFIGNSLCRSSVFAALFYMPVITLKCV